MKSKSLRKQLVLSLSLGLIVLFFASHFVVFSYIKDIELQSYDETLRDQLQSVMAVTRILPDGSARIELNEFEYRDFLPSSSEKYFLVRSPDKRVLLRSPSLGEKFLPVLGEEPGAIEIKDLYLPDGRKGRAASILFSPSSPKEASLDRKQKEAPPSSVYLTVAQSREKLDYLIRIEWLFGLLTGALLISGAAVLVWSLVSRIFKRIGTFTEQVRLIDHERLSNRLCGEGIPRELLPFKRQFNQLLDRLEAGFEREKRFNANISHELRTPIAELKLLNEVALQEAKEKEVQSGDVRYFEDALELVRRMERLVDMITAIHQSGEGRLKVHPSEFELVPLLQETVAFWEETCRQFGKSLEMEFGASPAIIHTDRHLLAAILSNLFSNAVDHSTREGTIRSRLSEVQGAYEFELTNPCGDLEFVDLRRMAEPFWQKDASRSSESHAGLGFSLVVCYCRILGIEWNVELLDSRQFRIRLRIPIHHPETKIRLRRNENGNGRLNTIDDAIETVA